MKTNNNLFILLLTHLITLFLLIYILKTTGNLNIVLIITLVVVFIISVFLTMTLSKAFFKQEDELELYKNILDLASDSIFIADENATIILYSRNAAKNLGYNSEELKLKTFFDFDEDLTDEEFQKFIKELTYTPITFERTHTRKDGSKFLAQIVTSKLEISDKTYYYSSSRDITEIKNNEKLLKHRDEQQRTLLSLFDIGSIILGRISITEEGTKLEYISKNVKSFLGYDSEDFVDGKIKYYNLIEKKDLKNFLYELQEIKNSSKNYYKHTPYRIMTKDGEVKWMLTYARIQRDEAGKVSQFLSLSIDITKEQNNLRNLQKFIDTQDNLVILTDGLKITFANKKFFEFMGIESLNEFRFKYGSIDKIFVENDRFFHIGKVLGNQNWVEAIKSSPPSQRVVSMIGKDFNLYGFSVSVNEFDDDLYIVSFSDISETMINQIHLEEKTQYDKLTGAYNREYFDRNIDRLIRNYQSKEYKVAIAFIDIDFFKRVNDTYGHDVGDEVLTEFVETIKKYSRDDDILIRWGGEEFILILKIKYGRDLKSILEHIRSVVENRKFNVIDSLQCSIGASVYQDEENIEKCIKRADEGVYMAKANGRNQVVIIED